MGPGSLFRSVKTHSSRTTCENCPDLALSQYPPSLKRLHSSADVTRWMVGVGLLGMISVQEISAMLRQVALSGISLDDFDEWLTRQSWDMHKDSDPAAIAMVGRIERLFAEHERDLITDDDLLQSLQRMNGIYLINVQDEPHVVSAGSVNTYSAPTVRFEPSADADRRFSMEFSYTPPLPG